MTSRTWFTSDIHLQHRLVAHLRGHGPSREEADVDAHDAEIAQAWDSVVRPDDVVWVLGDLTISKPGYTMDWIRARPGRKQLVAGNHDGCHPMHRRWLRETRKWLEVFETVQALAAVRMAGHTVVLSHFPYGDEMEGADHTIEPRYMEWRPANHGMWLLHGHTHMADQKLHGRSIHVGFDAWRRLVHSDELAIMIREAEGV